MKTPTICGKNRVNLPQTDCDDCSEFEHRLEQIEAWKNRPPDTSEFTNGAGFITDADVPTKTSDLTNDSGFITSADSPTIPTKTSELTNDSGYLTLSDLPIYNGGVQ